MRVRLICAGNVTVSSCILSLDIDNEMGDEELEVELIVPLQKILDLCRSTRGVSRKLVKRVEDLINDSSALKAVFVPRLQHLVGLMALALNFGVNMAQQVRGYLLDVKDKKEAYKLTRVLEIVRITAGEVKTGGGIGSWQTVSDLLTQLQRDSSDVVSIASESESVMKSKHSFSFHRYFHSHFILHPPVVLFSSSYPLFLYRLV